MSQETTENFIAALGKLEQNGELDGIVSLYAENCEVGNAASPKMFSGTNGAREFWENYRKTFAGLKSSFRNKIETDKTSALEWETVGKTSDGNEIRYTGVSVLETGDGKITRFFAYFDPANLGKQIKGDNDGKNT